MLLADANGPYVEDFESPVDVEASPTATVSGEPTTMTEVPVAVEGTATPTGLNWSFILTVVVVLAAIGLVVTLYLRNKK